MSCLRERLPQGNIKLKSGSQFFSMGFFSKEREVEINDFNHVIEGELAYERRALESAMTEIPESEEKI